MFSGRGTSGPEKKYVINGCRSGYIRAGGKVCAKKDGRGGSQAHKGVNVLEISKAKIEEARRRLDKSSRGFDEEYYAHLLAVNEELKILRRRVNGVVEMRKVIYVAHPFSGKKENIDKVEKLIIEMVRQYPDFAFYSPLHAMGFYYFEKPYEEGMKDCLEMLSRCDELWLCKGWEDSRGCNMEKDFAEAHGIPIRYWGD